MVIHLPSIRYESEELKRAWNTCGFLLRICNKPALCRRRDSLMAANEVSLELSVNAAVLAIVCDMNMNISALGSSGCRWLCVAGWI